MHTPKFANAPASKKTPRDPFKQNNPSSLDYLELPVYGPLEPSDSLPVSQDEPFNPTLRFPAHKPLFKLSLWDVFRVGDSFENIAIIGATSSAKSSTSLFSIVQANAEAGYGGLLQGPKADFCEKIEHVLSNAGTLNRSIRLADGYYGINLIRATAESHGSPDGMEENIIDVIFSGSEVVVRTMSAGQGEAFFVMSGRSVGKKLIVLDQADQGSVDVRRLLAMSRSIPRSPQDLGDDWNNRAVLATIQRVRAKYPVGANYAIDDAINYFTVEAPNVGDRAIGSIIATLAAYLEPWCDEIVYNAVCKDSGTWKLSDLREKGLIVINGYPLKRGFENVGAIIGAALKRAVQRQLESELKGPQSKLRPVMIVLDDAGCYANTDDVKFLQTGREARAAVVWAFHSLSVLRDQFGGTDAALNKVKALLSFFMTIIGHQLNDEETGRYLSGRGGEHWVKKDSWNRSEASKDGGGKSQISEGSSSQYVLEPWVPYWGFARLKRGGERNGGVATAIVMRPDHFKHGDRPFLKIRQVQEPLYHPPDDPPKNLRDRVDRWRHRCNYFLGRNVFIWFDRTPRLRIWNGHVPFYKLRADKRLLEQWLYFWLDEREFAVYEEARDESRH